jgi:hypothetical protein
VDAFVVADRVTRNPTDPDGWWVPVVGVHREIMDEAPTQKAATDHMRSRGMRAPRFISRTTPLPFTSPEDVDAGAIGGGPDMNPELYRRRSQQLAAAQARNPDQTQYYAWYLVRNGDVGD